MSWHEFNGTNRKEDDLGNACTYLHEESEFWIFFKLLPHLLFRDRMITNISRVRFFEIRGHRIKEDIADPSNNRRLFPLPNAEDLQQSFVDITNLKQVAKYLIEEVVQITGSDGKP